MIIYVDDDFKCHVSNDGSMREIETDFFDGKCNAFIEGYRYVPEGETWTRSDGAEFNGTMIAPFIDFKELEIPQLIYEKGQAEEAFQILLEGVETE